MKTINLADHDMRPHHISDAESIKRDGITIADSARHAKWTLWPLRNAAINTAPKGALVAMKWKAVEKTDEERSPRVWAEDRDVVAVLTEHGAKVVVVVGVCDSLEQAKEWADAINARLKKSRKRGERNGQPKRKDH